jgi:hypothetical protein
MGLLKNTTFRANLAKSPVRRPLIWLRHRGLHDSDMFLASYPRSGNTWLRFVLSEALSGEEIDFDNINSFIPELKWHKDARPLLQGNGRVIKTHEHYRKEYKKAIYIVRDVRDCALSQHARTKEIGISPPDFDVYLRQYLEGHANQYGTWHQHLRSWLDGTLAKEGKLLVIKFEDLRRNPEDAVTRMVLFAGVPMDAERIRAALANNSVDRMRAKEEKSQKLFQSKTEQGRFVRKGAVQGWRATMTPAQLQMFERYAGPELARMGYSSAAEVEAARVPQSVGS